MSLFGGGLSAAAALRARILERLGAEEEWTRASDDLGLVAWMSGPAVTFFRIGDGAEGTPDLGILRIVTPVAAIGDAEAALAECDRLNQGAITSRWTVEVDRLGADALAVACTFIVGPHNLGHLEAFATWCAREQIAAAIAQITGGIARRVAGAQAGGPAGPVAAPHPWGPYPDWSLRPGASAAVRGYEDDARPGRAESSAPLARALVEAFEELIAEMAEQGTGEWGAWTDATVLTCETPMTWAQYPDDFIGQVCDEAPDTAIMTATRDDHPRAGNGLRVALRIPWSPVEQALQAVARMNRLDAEVRGATHSLGAWSLESQPSEDGGDEPGYVYSVYLPAALAGAHGPADMTALMREVLLTVARQGLLWRRMLAASLRTWEDDHPYVGLAARPGDTAWHGLAWGETGEGRNPGAQALDYLYAQCVGADTDWADARPDGFTWWPYEQAQHVAVIPGDTGDTGDEPALAVLRVWTDVRREVPATPAVLAAIARLNARLGRSVLVLADDGTLSLACHLALADEGPWVRRWAHALAVDQYSTARDLAFALPAAGQPARSSHQFAGPRPDRGELLGLRDAMYAPLARGTRPALTTRVALLATAGLGLLPHRLAIAGDGGVEFTWHPSQGDIDLPVDPAITVRAFVGDTGSGPGWVVRTRLPVTAAAGDKARWCNEQNAALLDGPGAAHLHVTGGWGLGPDGECCLTTWLSPFMVSGESNQVQQLLGLMRDHQGAVFAALESAGPATVDSSPLTPASLAAGLREVLASLGRALEHAAGYRWSVEARDVGVVVTLSGPLEDGADAAELAEAGPAGGDAADDGRFRTVVQVPVTCHRPELGVLYAAYLGQSLTRVQTPASYDLVPGELPRWKFSLDQVGYAVWRLGQEGMLTWPEGDPAGRFDAGPRPGRLEIVFRSPDRLYQSAALRVAGVIDSDALPALPHGEAGDIDLLGTWRRREDGIAYEVTVPPAGTVWGSEGPAAETLTWIVRHVVRHVQAAVPGGGA
ncbi:MAG TPA: hypothetical protein VH478_23320 [Trebonia sp.]|nr:hypothetical protein [Trebonia sp.]